MQPMSDGLGVAARVDAKIDAFAHHGGGSVTGDTGCVRSRGVPGSEEFRNRCGSTVLPLKLGDSLRLRRPRAEAMTSSISAWVTQLRSVSEFTPSCSPT